MRKETEKKYPKNWAKISSRIRDRAGHACEECGLKGGHPIDYRTQKVVSERTYLRRMKAAESNYYSGLTEPDLEALMSGDYDNGYWAEGDFYPMNEGFPKIASGVTRVVLQVHHNDRNPSNNQDSNLICLCLRCHNAKHKPLVAANANRS